MQSLTHQGGNVTALFAEGTMIRRAQGPAFKDLDILLAEIHRGQRHRGVADGARALLEGGLGHALAHTRHHVQSTEELGASIAEAKPRGQDLCDLANAVERSLTSGGFPLTLGGDHSIAFATLEGVLRAVPDARILYIDAHADLNTPSTSPSGNTHGMPVAAHLGFFGPKDLADAACVGGRLSPDRIAYVGLRDVDEGERHFLRRHDIAHFSSADIMNEGANTIMQKALDAIDPEGRHPLFVSFDVDVMDPDFLPATGVPVNGGLDMAAAIGLAQAVARTDRLIGMDLVEINPDLAPDAASLRRCLDAATSIVTSFLG